MQVGPGTDHAALPHEAPWLLSGGSSQANAVASLVVKPDMLFGQRGKHDLVGLRLTWPQASAFIAEVREDPHPVRQPTCGADRDAEMERAACGCNQQGHVVGGRCNVLLLS
jgi:hypothetical protein